MNIHEDKWLITGAAGFIGSHIVASLLQKGIKVVGLDNFSTGDQSRLDSALAKVDMKFQNNFEFVKADILDEMMLRKVTAGIRYISHQAALVSAPDSISKPMEYLDVNLKGFISVAMAAIANKVKRIVYASSSSVYGSNISCPLKEDDPTYPLTPYAATKKACEDFAYTFAGNSETSFVGLRYFNVFGPEQNIGGGYGAVIPSWIVKAISNKIPEIYGDPNSTRDYIYVKDIARANIKAGYAKINSQSAIYNIGSGQPLSLGSLFEEIKVALAMQKVANLVKPIMLPARIGDPFKSEPSVEAANDDLNFTPKTSFDKGISETINWFVTQHTSSKLVYK